MIGDPFLKKNFYLKFHCSCYPNSKVWDLKLMSRSVIFQGDLNGPLSHSHEETKPAYNPFFFLQHGWWFKLTKTYFFLKEQIKAVCSLLPHIWIWLLYRRSRWNLSCILTQMDVEFLSWKHLVLVQGRLVFRRSQRFQPLGDIRQGLSCLSSAGEEEEQRLTHTTVHKISRETSTSSSTLCTWIH